MSTFAKVAAGIVTDVIVADQAFIDSGMAGDPSAWVQTDMNTRAGIHYGSDGAPDDGTALRGNYAAIGDTYDAVNDVFYGPKPYPSWTIAAPAWTWQAPVAYPTDGGNYVWNESTQAWVPAS